MPGSDGLKPGNLILNLSWNPKALADLRNQGRPTATPETVISGEQPARITKTTVSVDGQLAYLLTTSSAPGSPTLVAMRGGYVVDLVSIDLTKGQSLQAMGALLPRL